MDPPLVRSQERCPQLVSIFISQFSILLHFTFSLPYQDPYFPHGIVDLRYAIACDPVGEKEFRIRTNQKTVLLYADSVPSQEEWVKAVRKVIFKAQNMGDSVKVSANNDMGVLLIFLCRLPYHIPPFWILTSPPPWTSAKPSKSKSLTKKLQAAYPQTRISSRISMIYLLL